jgi:hypothetical protein
MIYRFNVKSWGLNLFQNLEYKLAPVCEALFRIGLSIEEKALLLKTKL